MTTLRTDRNICTEADTKDSVKSVFSVGAGTIEA